MDRRSRPLDCATNDNSPPGEPRVIDAAAQQHTPGPESLDGVSIADTFAEAFPMVAARAIITADTPGWAETAARTMTGYATSVIACSKCACRRRNFRRSPPRSG